MTFLLPKYQKFDIEEVVRKAISGGERLPVAIPVYKASPGMLRGGRRHQGDYTWPVYEVPTFRAVTS